MESNFVRYNANPENNRVGDCTVRALSVVLDQDWETTYAGLALEGFLKHNMPSANSVWGKYLRRKGFRRKLLPDDDDAMFGYTVKDFCRDNPQGTFLLAIDGHVVAVKDGKYFDTWDSGYEIPIYFWYKEDK